MKSRRAFLRTAFTMVVGVGILLISGGLAEEVHSTEILSSSRNNSTMSKASLVSVIVYYSLMTQYTNANEEYFVLQSPATLQDLMNTIVVRHPSLTQMIQMMFMLLNGVPAKPTASLKDGDQVQFIPFSAGG